ncbi:MAG: hypothetical protein U1A25_01535 [Candidatus Sungbacteria bacterium]|nr:hypothetical protein [bacterium]MDZ4260323.1 hypothetical protein [Candidatus Sungbacteria bacterium]
MPKLLRCLAVASLVFGACLLMSVPVQPAGMFAFAGGLIAFD